MSTRETIVAALLLVPGAGLVVAACADRTEEEYWSHGAEQCKTCGEGAWQACGETQFKSSGKAGEKMGRDDLARRLYHLREPHPQSPYYRGPKMESFVRIKGSVNKGRINGVSGSDWNNVMAYDSANAETLLKVKEMGVDPCIKDAKRNQIGTPPPMYVVTVAADKSEAPLCQGTSSKYAGDVFKCNAEHEALQGKALALPGYWDDKGRYVDDGNSFTLACMSGVAAKCAHWGYVPWEKYTKEGSAEPTDLLPYYKACVHAARADYQGNGTYNTCNNTEIDIYDNLGIAAKDEGFDWAFEAAWREDKAACAARPRYDLSSGGKSCLGTYAASADCAQKCNPGADPKVLVCNRVRRGLKMPSGENVCPGADRENCACDPFNCVDQPATLQ